MQGKHNGPIPHYSQSFRWETVSFLWVRVMRCASTHCILLPLSKQYVTAFYGESLDDFLLHHHRVADTVWNKKKNFFLCILAAEIFYISLCSYVSSDGRSLFCCSFPLMKWLFYWITGLIWNDKRYSDTFLYLLIEYLWYFLCRRLKSIISRIYISSSFIFSVPLTIALINSLEFSVPLSAQINI